MQITLSAPWTYRTPLVTIDYAPGAHDVVDDIAAAAPQEELTNGIESPATPRPARGTRKAKG